MDCFWKIRAEEGLIRGMYKGTLATLARDMPGTMGWYGAYYGFKNLAKREDGTYSKLGLLNAGGAAGIAMWIIGVGTMGWYGAYYGFKNLAKREDGTYSK